MHSKRSSPKGIRISVHSMLRNWQHCPCNKARSLLSKSQKHNVLLIYRDGETQQTVMTNLRKELEKCKHPNSRKTKALSKKARRQNNKHKSRLGHAIKSNLTGEKLSWFLEHIDEERQEPLTPKEFEDLIKLYLKRFDEELAQIALRQSISKNRAKQHVAREDVIKITLEKEKSEYYGGGIELINLCDADKLKSLIDWDGSAINVQHLKLDLISQGLLSRLQQSLEKNTIVTATPTEDMETT